ncbi:hypothetical protein [Nocardia lasii]|uniref:Uncharacterized protein n=1 Tax=Nocardia lasii TaxID=1616107 RepID=A0ABW1JW72_9NOCA
MTDREKPPKQAVPLVNPVVKAAAEQVRKPRPRTETAQLELFSLNSVTRKKNR